jgi:hypothetical protein
MHHEELCGQTMGKSMKAIVTLITYQYRHIGLNFSLADSLQHSPCISDVDPHTVMTMHIHVHVQCFKAREQIFVTSIFWGLNEVHCAYSNIYRYHKDHFWHDLLSPYIANIEGYFGAIFSLILDKSGSISGILWN